MKRKPLMMMRTRGISGPKMAHHHGVNRTGLPLSKSVGNFIGLGPSVYNPNSVLYDGTNDYLSTTGLTGVTDGSKGTIAVRISNIINPGNRMLIYDLLSNRINFGLTFDNKIELILRSSSGDTLLNSLSDLSLSGAPDPHNILFSWDTSIVGADIQLYVDDVLETGALSSTLGDVNYNSGDVNIARLISFGGYFSGCLSNLYFNYEDNIDFSVEDNRRLFFNTAGGLVYLGANGELPTGNPPSVFLDNPFGTVNVNKGTGGNFMINGSPMECV